MSSRFQRRHYEFVAKVLYDACQECSDEYTPPKQEQDFFDQTHFIAAKFAEQFGNDNPNFKRERFMKACGFGDD